MGLVNFTANPAGGLPPYTFFWDFDDGDTSTAENPSHGFSEAGTYNVLLEVTDSCGQFAEDTIIVEIVECIETGCCPENLIPPTLKVTFTNPLPSPDYDCLDGVEVILTYSALPTPAWTSDTGAFCGEVELTVSFSCDEGDSWFFYVTKGGHDEINQLSIESESCDPFSVEIDCEVIDFGGPDGTVTATITVP